MTDTDEIYMRRAIQLAAKGAGRVSPNPQVGAVVTARGEIIGEGWHRAFGGPHAEVNAIASVRRRDLLREATVYVTLEPCSHYGKTPPCADLLVESGVRRVVVGMRDPFPAVSGRGIRRLAEAGISVTEGVLESECAWINRAFVTAHTMGRPFVQLKWAESADGFMSAVDAVGDPVRTQLSDPLSQMWMHRERALADAIMVGTRTVNTDDPRLDVRFWPGRDPLRVTFNRCGRLDPRTGIARDPRALKLPGGDLQEVLAMLCREHGVTRLMVEGGAELLASFIAEGLWDEIRVERVPGLLRRGIAAPAIPRDALHAGTERCRSSLITRYLPSGR